MLFLSFHTEAKLLGNSNATCSTAAEARPQALADMKPIQVNLHLPLLSWLQGRPLLATRSQRNGEALLLRLVSDPGGQNGDCHILCVSRGKL